MDEAWVCAGCHSINLARAGRCYHCHLRRGESPVAEAAEPNVLRVAPAATEPAATEPTATEPTATAPGGPSGAPGVPGGLVGAPAVPGRLVGAPGEPPIEARIGPAPEGSAAPSDWVGFEVPETPPAQPLPQPVIAAPVVDRSRRPTTLLAGLAVLVAAAVLVASATFLPGWLGSAGSSSPAGSSGLASSSPGGPSASSAGASASSAGASASSGGASATATQSSSASATATSGATTGARILDGAIGGTWLARVTLVPSGSADLTGQVPFQDRVLDIQPGCASEPCPTAKLRIFLLNDPQAVYEATLQRSGDTYRSAPADAGSAPCLTSSGSQVPSGATVTRTVSAWRERVTTPGTAVTSEHVRGEVRYDATPTKIGDLAGCAKWSAVYQVAAEDPWSVPTVPPSPSPEPTPPPGSGLVTLPALTYPIAGANVQYFPVTGSTAAALIDSMPRSGVKACGEIQYDWYEGDPRPVGCVLPTLNQGFLAPRVDAAGACRIAVSGSAFSYTVELPQWTQPRFVPKPLLDWWRRVLAFVGAHEATHIQIFQRYAAMLPGRLAGVDCLQAPSKVNAWAAELQAAQEAFDKAEYAKPWPMPPAGY